MPAPRNDSTAAIASALHESLAELPWTMLAAFFVPVVLLMLLNYGAQRWHRAERGLPAAAPAVQRMRL